MPGRRMFGSSGKLFAAAFSENFGGKSDEISLIVKNVTRRDICPEIIVIFVTCFEIWFQTIII
jgi:hypothetical protein